MNSDRHQAHDLEFFARQLGLALKMPTGVQILTEGFLYSLNWLGTNSFNLWKWLGYIIEHIPKKPKTGATGVRAVPSFGHGCRAGAVACVAPWRFFIVVADGK